MRIYLLFLLIVLSSASINITGLWNITAFKGVQCQINKLLLNLTYVTTIGSDIYLTMGIDNTLSHMPDSQQNPNGSTAITQLVNGAFTVRAYDAVDMDSSCQFDLKNIPLI